MPITDFSRTQPPRPDWLALAPTEAPIEPDIAIVDPHMHLWHHSSGYRYFVEEFAADVAASGRLVDATVFIECRSMYRAGGPDNMKSLGETEFAAGMAAIAASRKYTAARVAAGIVSHADMLDPGLDGVLDAHTAAAGGRLRGIRQGAKWDADPAVRGPVAAAGPGIYRDPAFHRGVRTVAARGLLFECSVFHPQIPEVTALARAVPDAQIVLIHTGSPVGHASYAGRTAEVHAQWLAAMTDLARCTNVSVKLGGLLMSLGDFDFAGAPRPLSSAELAVRWEPYIAPCIDLFGVARCMASSNFPVEKAGLPYGTIWNSFARIMHTASRDERRAVLGGTAKRLYAL